MSTYFNDINVGLDNRLLTLEPTHTVVLENTEYDEENGAEYLSSFFLPADTDQACLGENGLDVTTGIYQVNVNYPSGSGSTQTPDIVADLFRRGTLIDCNSCKVRVLSASRSTAIKDRNFRSAPVTISWRTYTEPRS